MHQVETEESRETTAIRDDRENWPHYRISLNKTQTGEDVDRFLNVNWRRKNELHEVVVRERGALRGVLVAVCDVELLV